jgi:hypothetical protein
VPLVLRKIRKAKWYKNSNVGWLKEGELQADSLGELITKSNALSVYHIENDKSNLERVVTAIAATGDALSAIDYALIDTLILEEIGIKNVSNLGGTPDDIVNNLHRDLIELTLGKLNNLAQAIQSKAMIERESEKNIKKRLADGVLSGELDKVRMKITMLDSLGL